MGLESNAEAEIGDTVKVQFIERRPANKNFAYRSPHENALDSVTGVIIGFWTVFHSSQPRRDTRQFYSGNDTDFDARDAHIIDLLSRSSYTSPTDAVIVVVPELPPSTIDSAHEDMIMRSSPMYTTAQRLSRTALRERARQSRLAWRDWRTSLIKPADIIDLLRPTGVQQETCASWSDCHSQLPRRNQARLCIVHRFWEKRKRKAVICLDSLVNVLSQSKLKTV